MFYKQMPLGKALGPFYQDSEDGKHPVLYLSRKLLPQEQKFSVIEDCFADKVGSQGYCCGPFYSHYGSWLLYMVRCDVRSQSQTDAVVPKYFLGTLQLKILIELTQLLHLFSLGEQQRVFYWTYKGI